MQLLRPAKVQHLSSVTPIQLGRPLCKQRCRMNNFPRIKKEHYLPSSHIGMQTGVVTDMLLVASQASQREEGEPLHERTSATSRGWSIAIGLHGTAVRSSQEAPCTLLIPQNSQLKHSGSLLWVYLWVGKGRPENIGKISLKYRGLVILVGGEGGIRTHVGRNALNRFRVGAVMTASVPLRPGFRHPS